MTMYLLPAGQQAYVRFLSAQADILPGLFRLKQSIKDDLSAQQRTVRFQSFQRRNMC